MILTDKDKVLALVSMLLGFRNGETDIAIVQVIDRKLAEICPDEREEVESMIRGGFQ